MADIVGGAIGLMASVGIGYAFDTLSCNKDEWFCGLVGLIIRDTIGESIGLPTGRLPEKR